MPGFAREPNGGFRPNDPPTTEPGKPLRVERSSSDILLAITDLIVGGAPLPGLLDELTPLLRQLTNCKLVEFSICSYGRECATTYFWGADREVRPWDAFSVDAEETPNGWTWKRQEPLLVPDLQHETRFPAALKELRNHGMRSHIVVPMSSKRRRYGTLAISGTEPEPADSETLVLLERAARLVALAVENHEIHARWEKQQSHLQSLLEIGRDLASTLDFDAILGIVFAKLRQVTTCDFARLALLDEDSKTLRTRSFDASQNDEVVWRSLPLAGAVSESVIESRKIAFFDAPDLTRFNYATTQDAMDAGVQSLCCVPLLMGGRSLGALLLGATRAHAFSREDGDYLQQVTTQVASAIHNANVYSEVARAKDRLTREKRYLENEIGGDRLEHIVGNSRALKCVLDNAAIVANTDATVLISGETGTGKERVARAIHMMSSRRDRPFIKLNCAAIPTGLLESELFGHEKGAFTGAVTQKVGRLELADRGTLLLDEIGEIPLELQPKLLRVLQDQEFERLGGTRTIRVDARILAASNRDLVRAVKDKEFRSDLYYRLNVFPIHLPPLRERREDIPLLIRYFVQKCAERMNKRITLISDEAVEVMINWRWPGNIRELENFIERSVILSEGERLRPPLAELRDELEKHPPDVERTLRDRERDHIIDILRQTRGVLSGTKGAASRLGLKRTTLQHKIQKLGILRGDYLD